MTALLLFVGGVVLAAAGGDLFVRGVLAAGKRLRLPARFAGATIAAFATSGPELGVSVLAALEGTPQLGLGNALGGNVVNLGLVLGVVLIAAGARAAPSPRDRRLLFLVAAPLLVGALAFDGMLSRFDALLLLGSFVAWLATELHAVWRTLAPHPHDAGDTRALLLGTLGLLLLFVAGELIVRGASAMALRWGFDAYVVGASVVALGTSMPELATALAARARGHHEVGIATLLGSNLFNGLFIVGTAALIHPIAADPREVAVSLGAALLLTLLLLPGAAAGLGRRDGVLLLAGYFAYVAALLTAGN